MSILQVGETLKGKLLDVGAEGDQRSRVLVGEVVNYCKDYCVVSELVRDVRSPFVEL